MLRHRLCPGGAGRLYLRRRLLRQFASSERNWPQYASRLIPGTKVKKEGMRQVYGFGTMITGE